MRNITRNTQVAVLILTLFSSAMSWGAVEEPGKGHSGEEQRLEGKADLTARPEVKNLHETATKVEESQIVSILGLSFGDVKRVLRLYKAQPEQYQSLRNLLEETLKSPNAETTALIRSYVRLLSSSVSSGFHLQPVELAKRASNWSPAAKAKLATVLERADVLAKASKAGTAEEAFRKALREMGLEQKYDEKCRKPSTSLF